MTEKEYINASNLANIRATKKVLTDFFPQTKYEEKNFQAAFTALTNLEARFASIVATKE